MQFFPEFKGKGLGKILCKEWMKICPNQMAICSDDSLRVLKKFGWKDNFATKRLVRPINTLKFFTNNEKSEAKFC